MASSLFSALSGLRAHEQWLTIIGNNLANANTPGYKSSRTVFSDQFNRTLRFASLPGGTLGGKNPLQIGSGVKLSDVGRNFGQGTLSNTGRTFDLALNGEGFFVVSDGTNRLYTRVGTFGLDGDGRLVDQRTGFLVMSPTGQQIDVDTNAQLPPQATSHVELAGNLPAVVTGPLAQVVTTSSGLLEGTQAQMVGGATEPFSIPAGETWTLELIVNGVAPQQVQMTGPGPFTAQDFADAINALGLGVTAVSSSGALQITTERSGAAASIKVQPGTAGRDLAGLLGLSTSLVTGSESSATLSTPLNSLPTNLVDYSAGEAINISGIDGDGSPVSGSFIFGSSPPTENGTTVGELLSFIDGLFDNAEATFDANTGQISLTSDLTGESSLTLTMVDGTATTRTNWAQHAFTITTLGAGPDMTSTAIEVYDQSGIAHTVTFELQREDNGSWRITPVTPNGSVSPSSITGLTFNNDGSIQSLPTTTTFSITFSGQTVPQQIDLGMGTPSTITGLTQFGEPASVFVDSQDGYGVGSLSSISVNGNGDIQGFYSNGQIETLGEIGVATFVNSHGLREITDNLWSETANTGARTNGKATVGPAGEIVAGALESSNVEVAEEFVNLIEAQRGFQANARMISTTDEVLAELVNLL